MKGLNGNLLVGSSSFLSPEHFAWNKLKNNFNVSFLEYGQWLECLVSEGIELTVCYLNLEDLAFNKKEKFDELLSELRSLLKNKLDRQNEKLIFVLSTFCKYQVIANAQSINPHEIFKIKFLLLVDNIFNEYKNFFFIDFDKVILEHGIKKIFDQRNWYFAHMRLSNFGLSTFIEATFDVVDRINKPSSKVLILDCDNTLWGGVIGEEGLDNIKLGTDGIGKVFSDFQTKIKQISKKGIILAICSKNNEEDVFNVLDNHHGSYLTRKDFTINKINWEEKTKNIQEIAKELNLSMDSFVFWDDNPLEREKVRTMCPLVKVIEPDRDIAEWPMQIESITTLQKFEVLKEDKEKKDQYAMKLQFDRQLSEADDISSFLSSLEIKIELLKIEKQNISRAVQLINKTNQFNFRNIRMDSNDVFEVSFKNGNICKLVKVSDKYGDHGIVGFICFERYDNQTCFLNSFLLSCRILGRDIETELFDRMKMPLKEKGYKKILVEFRPSERNKVVEKFIEKSKFLLTADRKKYEEDLKQNFTGRLYLMNL